MRHAMTLLLLPAVLAASPAAVASKHGKENSMPAARKNGRPDPEQLLRVIMPVDSETASAHPFVNVIVRFGATNGVAVDPTSFRGRLDRINVTPLFEPIQENGALVGMRAALSPALLRPGRRLNRLRLEVRGQGRRRTARLRDVDRIRFRATDLPDQAPVARALASSDVILAGILLQFDATQSHDPDADVLKYHWDFGDGATSSDARPAHTFASNASDVTVRLTVSDGQLESADQVTMLAVPPLDTGRTPGLLSLDAPSALEFGGVAIGASATRTFTVRNDDPTPTSQLKVRLGLCEHDWSTGTCTDGTQFALSTGALNLAPGESAPVDLAFAPSTGGHRSAQITLVGSASNQNTVHVLSHGYGGAAPGTGPLPIADTLFFKTDASGPQGIFPSGARFFADNTVHACVVPNNGPGTGDVCLTDADCAANHGTCPQTSTCVRGTSAAQSCATPADCPGGICPAYVPFDAVDMDRDGEGGLYLLSKEGTFTDPSPNAVTQLAGTLLHLRFDANGTRTGAEIVTRTSVNTSQVASDGLPAAAGGQIYIAQYQALPDTCFRDALEQLVALRKSDGASTVLVPRIDAAEGLDPCNDLYDPADDLKVPRDGSAAFVALPGGIYRVRPTALLMTPDIDGIFDAHPDHSIVVVTSRDQGLNGLLLVYKISPAQAVNASPHLSDLTPCATVAVPNNGTGPGVAPLATVVSFAVDSVDLGSADGVIVMSFLSSGGGSVLPSALRVQGTLAIMAPGGTNTCSVIGLMNLEPLDQMTF